MKVDGFPSPREPRQKVDILGGGHQGLPLYHEGLYIRVPIVNQGVQQPWLSAHKQTQKEFYQPTLHQYGHNIRIYGH
jgi:hypothetical protein